jgi:hypothetical protein
VIGKVRGEWWAFISVIMFLLGMVIGEAVYRPPAPIAKPYDPITANGHLYEVLYSDLVTHSANCMCRRINTGGNTGGTR